MSMPDLRLDLLVVGSGLDVAVTGAVTTDLLAPGRYLVGGEVVLSSLMFRRGPADSETFVQHLVSAGVAGLVAGTANGPVPSDLVHACRRHGLPLLAVVPEVSFRMLTEQVMFHQNRFREMETERSQARWRRMVSAVAAGEGSEALLAGAALDLGHKCTVLTATGRVLAGPGLGEDIVPALVHAYLTAARLPCSVSSPVPFTVLGIGTTGRRIAGRLLVVPVSRAELSSDQWEVLTDLSEAIDLEQSRHVSGVRVERRLADRLLHILDGAEAGTAELSTAMRSGGLRSGRSLVAVSARRIASPGRPRAIAPDEVTVAGRDLAAADLTRVILEELLLTASTRPVVAVGGEDCLALAEVSPDDLPALLEALRTAAAGLAPGLGRERLVVGVSGVGTAPGGLRGLVEEARQARQVAEQETVSVNVMTAEDIDSYVLLLANTPDAVRTAYHQRLLGSVLEYDALRQSDLMRTLEVFLQHSGSWSAAASDLHLHVNTLRYRIGRIEQLTGRNLSQLEHQVDLFLALRARRSQPVGSPVGSEEP
jgi:hypothetical protein